MQTLNFSHEYYKLKNPFFTTIRGKTAMKKYKCGPVEIQLKKEFYCDAEIYNIGQGKISDLPLTMLVLDGEYPGHAIFNHQDFIDLLNSFRHPLAPKATLDSEITIFYLKK